jgi:predicted nuclease of predicted toxin-antitoxin system
VRWLLDERLPRTLVQQLTELDHDAVSVHDVELAGATDDDVFELAVHQERLIVTENIADFARLLEERQNSGAACVPIVFVRKRSSGEAS